MRMRLYGDDGQHLVSCQAGAAGGLPLAGWRVPPPALPILCLYYLLLGALGLKRKSRPPALALFLGLLVFIHTGGAPRRPAAAAFR